MACGTYWQEEEEQGGGRLTLRVRRDGRTGGCAANGGHLIERLPMQLRLCDIGLEERDKQMLGQIQRRLAVQKGIQEASKAIEVNVLRGSREKRGEKSCLMRTM